MMAALSPPSLSPPHHHPDHYGQPLRRDTVSQAVFASGLPPVLGQWQVDHYEQGAAIRTSTPPLGWRTVLLLGLSTLYASFSRHSWHTVPWKNPLTLWAATQAFFEGRQATDPLGQVQNGVNIALPMLVGGYVGAPLGNRVAEWWQNRENGQVHQAINQPYMRAVVQALTDEQNAQLEQKLASAKQAEAEARRRKQPLDLDEWLDINDLNEHVETVKQQNQAFLQTFDAFNSHLNQYHVQDVPQLRHQLSQLTGEFVRTASPHFSTDQQTRVLDTLSDAVKYLGKAGTDERVTAPYFNAAEAHQLSHRLGQARELVTQHTGMPEDVRLLFSQTITPVETLLAPPGELARHWFSPHRLANRLDTLEELKSNLHEQLSRFDRTVTEPALERLEKSPLFQGISRERQAETFKQVTRHVGQLIDRLADSQQLHSASAKFAGPTLGFLVGGALAGNWLATRINATLADAFPGLARRRTTLPPSQQSPAMRLDHMIGEEMLRADPAMRNLAEPDPQDWQVLPNGYYSWFTSP